jgi:hypothetical protein
MGDRRGEWGLSVSVHDDEDDYGSLGIGGRKVRAVEAGLRSSGSFAALRMTAKAGNCKSHGKGVHREAGI